MVGPLTQTYIGHCTKLPDLSVVDFVVRALLSGEAVVVVFSSVLLQDLQDLAQCFNIHELILQWP